MASKARDKTSRMSSKTNVSVRYIATLLRKIWSGVGVELWVASTVLHACQYRPVVEKIIKIWFGGGGGGGGGAK